MLAGVPPASARSTSSALAARIASAESSRARAIACSAASLVARVAVASSWLAVRALPATSRTASSSSMPIPVPMPVRVGRSGAGRPGVSRPGGRPRTTDAPDQEVGGVRWGVRSSGGSALALLDLLGRGGQHGVEVAHHAEVDELEDRRLGVLVDRDDRLATSACRRGAGSHRRCRWRCRAAGETVLPVCPTWKACGYPARVVGGTLELAPTAAPRASARASTVLEALRPAHAAPAGDHDRGLGELGAAGGLRARLRPRRRSARSWRRPRRTLRTFSTAPGRLGTPRERRRWA